MFHAFETGKESAQEKYHYRTDERNSFEYLC